MRGRSKWCWQRRKIIKANNRWCRQEVDDEQDSFLGTGKMLHIFVPEITEKVDVLNQTERNEKERCDREDCEDVMTSEAQMTKDTQWDNKRKRKDSTRDTSIKKTWGVRFEFASFSLSVDETLLRIKDKIKRVPRKLLRSHFRHISLEKKRSIWEEYMRRVYGWHTM